MMRRTHSFSAWLSATSAGSCIPQPSGHLTARRGHLRRAAGSRVWRFTLSQWFR